MKRLPTSLCAAIAAWLDVRSHARLSRCDRALHAICALPHSVCPVVVVDTKDGDLAAAIVARYVTPRTTSVRMPNVCVGPPKTAALALVELTLGRATTEWSRADWINAARRTLLRVSLTDLRHDANFVHLATLKALEECAHLDVLTVTGVDEDRVLERIVALRAGELRIEAGRPWLARITLPELGERLTRLELVGFSALAQLPALPASLRRLSIHVCPRLWFGAMDLTQDADSADISPSMRVWSAIESGALTHIDIDKFSFHTGLLNGAVAFVACLWSRRYIAAKHRALSALVLRIRTLGVAEETLDHCRRKILDTIAPASDVAVAIESPTGDANWLRVEFAPVAAADVSP